jgi:hypothetical protein
MQKKEYNKEVDYITVLFKDGSSINTDNMTEEDYEIFLEYTHRLRVDHIGRKSEEAMKEYIKSKQK